MKAFTKSRTELLISAPHILRLEKKKLFFRFHWVGPLLKLLISFGLEGVGPGLEWIFRKMAGSPAVTLKWLFNLASRSLNNEVIQHDCHQKASMEQKRFAIEAVDKLRPGSPSPRR